MYTSEAAHALARWKVSKANNQAAEARTWFAAVLMTAQESSEEIEAQAARIDEASPEYLSVQYNLARLLRLSGKQNQARTLLNNALKRPIESGSALNLLLQERFASANSLEDAGAFLFRGQVGYLNPGTKEISAASLPRDRITDSASWINQGLSMKDLLRLADARELPITQREHFAAMAWLRADLLEKNTLADRAIAKLAKLTPTRVNSAAQYQRAPTALLRRHAVVIAVISGLSTKIYRDVDSGNMYWQKVPDQTIPYSPEDEPEPPQLSTEPTTRDAEIAKLARIPLGNSFVAAHMLTYAAAYPKDPDLPELLAQVIASNKYSGGCRVDNKDCKKPFRLCFELLHKKYGKTKWAEQTRYWH